MTILDALLRPRGHRYKLLSKSTNDPSILISGTPEDRLAGLEPVLEAAAGRTAVDIGCHDGTIAEALARAGASRVDGCDIFEHGVAMSKQRVGAIQPNSSFYTVDLTGGPAALNALPLLPRYDIVCYLGMHQRMTAQMSMDRVRRLTNAILDRADDIFVARTPLKHFEGLHQMVSAAGFEPEGDYVKGSEGVGALRIYRRVKG